MTRYRRNVLLNKATEIIIRKSTLLSKIYSCTTLGPILANIFRADFEEKWIIST